MNYDQAKALMIEHHDNLLIDADDSLRHINVRKTENGQPFSIMLPSLPLPPAIEHRDAIPESVLEDGTIVPGSPEVQAVSGEAQREQQERKLFLDALRAAQAHL